MSDAVASARAALEALGAQERRRTPGQQARYELVAARARAIQVLGLRPADGVTFGRGKVARGDGEDG